MQKDKRLSFLVVQLCPSTILKGWEAVGRIPYSFSCLFPLAVALRDLGCAMTPFRSLPPLTSATNCHLLSSLLFAPPPPHATNLPPPLPPCRTRKPDGQTAKRGERRGGDGCAFSTTFPLFDPPPLVWCPLGKGVRKKRRGNGGRKRERMSVSHGREGWVGSPEAHTTAIPPFHHPSFDLAAPT